MKKILSLICIILLFVNVAIPVYGDEPKDITSPSYILMLADEGDVICEKNSDEKRAPASVTKIMTLILIFDAIRQGNINKEDIVTVSDNASAMGGSQVFLETGEQQSVETLIKCISVASANDACVAMAEYICGSEETFVERMNEKARELNMQNTHFVNCCGLDDDNHKISARDVAIMSRELINKYPEIFDYCTIWSEPITHVTKKGNKEFVLNNTNKLLKQYPYLKGLKTGSTSVAGCTYSAVATKDEITLIAVIMGAPNSKTRFNDAKSLLEYGFRVAKKYKDVEAMEQSIKVKNGVKSYVKVEREMDYEHTFINEFDEKLLEKKLEIYKVTAPIKKGDVVGKCIYIYDGSKIGEVNIISQNSIKKSTYGYYLKQVVFKWVH